jgi:hypothetical protein
MALRYGKYFVFLFNSKMDYNSDFRYDLKVGKVKEDELGDIFNTKTIEVKYDLKALETKNVFVEYFSRGYPSGIAKTRADYYCFCFGYTFHLIETSLLKEKCRKYLNTNRDRLGGDNNTSKGILLPINELF